MGAWKSIREMEDELTLEELYALSGAKQKMEHRDHRFAAALQGVDLDADKNDDAFERIQQKAAADLAGKSEEEYVFDMIGIAIESDDEDDY